METLTDKQRKEREAERKRAIPGWANDIDGRPQQPGESFGEFLDGKAQRNSDQVYMYFEDQAVSYRQLRERVSRIANSLLDMGIRKGDKVAVMMSNCTEHVYVMYALEAIGAVFVPLNVAVVGVGLAYLVNQSDSETIILEQQFLDSAKAVEGDLANLKRTIVLPAPGHHKSILPADCIPFETLYQGSDKAPHVTPQAGDILRIQYTSGTTGLPKGTVRRYPVPTVTRHESELPYLHKPEDITYVVLPLFHVLGQSDCRKTLEMEGTLGMIRHFSARRFWPEVRKFGCTRFTFAGSINHILLKQPPQPDDKDHTLRIGNGYAPIGAIRDEFFERFGVILIERYATSDNSGGLFNVPGNKKGSIGRVNEVTRFFRVADENDNDCPPHVIGEIITRPRAEDATVEYYKMPEASAKKVKGGWFRTGDYGYRDEEGWIFFSDRERQFIRRMGENISSFEIESIVNSHPDVLESTAVGVRSEFGGDQDVKICVVLKPGAKLAPEELIAYCENHMAYYMVPRYVDFRESLPKTGTERVQKYRLVDEGVSEKMWDREKSGYKLKHKK